MCPPVFPDSVTPYPSSNMQQLLPDTCAIKCQELILQQFGKDVDEISLAQEAGAAGWYIPGEGTPIEYMGNLLDLHQVPARFFENANHYTLIHELAQGHQVMVAVDSGELSTSSPITEILEDLLGISRADHAVIIQSLDCTQPENPIVHIIDPALGTERILPLSQFEEAWRDSSCAMVSTLAAPSEWTMDVENILEPVMGHEWAQVCTNSLQVGVELCSKLTDYAESHPQLVGALIQTAPYLFGPEVEGACRVLSVAWEAYNTTTTTFEEVAPTHPQMDNADCNAFA